MELNEEQIEKEIFTGITPISSSAMRIINIQMQKCVCKIISEKGNGTGFLCKIFFPNSFNLLPVLITNNHVLDEEDIKINKKIEFFLDNKALKLIINEHRKTYTNKADFDATIIEILEEDGLEIDSFLEINNLDIENNLNIYTIHYPLGDEISFSQGIIKSININGIDLEHNCSTEKGSSGCPIIRKDNYRVIGYHYGSKKPPIKINLGKIIKPAMKDFYNITKNNNKKIYKDLVITNEIDFSLFHEFIIIINDKIEELIDKGEIKIKGENIINIKKMKSKKEKKSGKKKNLNKKTKPIKNSKLLISKEMEFSYKRILELIFTKDEYENNLKKFG